jgi:hypothetical protein
LSTRPVDGCGCPNASAKSITDLTSSYNEALRLEERKRVFNVAGMYRLAAEAVARKVEEITSFEKIGGGAVNRAFVIQFRDDFRLVARIPYTITEPRQTQRPGKF